MINFFIDMYRFRKKINFYNYIKYYFSNLYIKDSNIVCLKLKQTNIPFYIRRGTSDNIVFRDFFLKDDYAITDKKTNIIVDAGANIGAASFLFKLRHPNSKIIAIEPEASNCNMFRLNLQSFNDVTLIEGGLHHSDNCKLIISNPEASKYSYKLQEVKDESGVDCIETFNSISINTLIQKYRLSKIDVLKIDIEGSEKYIFESNFEWLNITDQIIIELHDHYIPGCSSSLIKAISGLFFRISWSGENLVLNRDSTEL